MEMTREELREHCEKQVEACLDWHKVIGKPLGKVYEEHKLVLDLLDQDADKEKRLEELLESLQTANKTNETLIRLVDGKQESCEELFDDWHEAPSYAMTLDQAREAVHELRKEIVKLKKEPCEDAVSRAEALKGYIEVGRADGVEIYSEKAVPIEYINNLPPVTPTACIAKVIFDKDDLQELVDERVKELALARKKGKWIKHKSNMTCEDVDNLGDEDWDGTTYECSICHKEYFHTTNFCPNCGAEMEGVEDEEN